jgi:hypothetical protein
MNLLDIPHFRCGKNVGFYVKQLLARLNGGILWMDRLVPIDVDLISKMTRFPTSGVKHKNYLENKERDKKIVEEVKEHLEKNMGTKGIIIRTSTTLRRIFPKS